MIVMEISDITIDDELQPCGDARIEIDDYEAYAIVYIDKSDARAIVEHLTKLFDLENNNG